MPIVGERALVSMMDGMILQFTAIDENTQEIIGAAEAVVSSNPDVNADNVIDTFSL